MSFLPCAPTRFALLASLPVALLATAAGAADPGIYVGAGAGYGAQTLKQEPLITGPDEVFPRDIEGADLALRAFLGVRLHRHFALEAGYVDLGTVDASVPDLGGSGLVSDEVDSRAFEVMAVGVWPINRDFELFGKAGLAAWEADRTTDGVGGGKLDGEDLALGFGVDYLGTEHLRLRIEGMRYDWSGFDESIAVTASVFYAWSFGRR